MKTLIALVGDFEIAKILRDSTGDPPTMNSRSSTGTGIRGTIGYVAPDNFSPRIRGTIGYVAPGNFSPDLYSLPACA
jgi:hypothetical protein